MSDWLDVLNDEQREAVEATEGYICLHAGAGTGKTRTLTYRYAYLINEYGISPRSVWCVTFTNKAAIEMKQRVQQLCGNAVGNPFVTTFHAFCALFLREEIMAVGWPKTFTVSDVSDVKDLLRPLYQECEVDGKKLSLKKAWEFIDAKKGDRDYVPALIGPDSMELMKRSQEAAEDELKLFWRYLFAQRTTYSLDFDDLILLTLHILNHFPEVKERWQKRLEYIMVDEFQDIDSDQYELVEILAGKNNNLFIVGDPDQTIYSFRGARVEYFKNFCNLHAGQGRKLNLTYNYRSQSHILQAAYSVISNNPDPDRLPLVAMRTDITIDDMASTHDPNIRKEDRMSPDVAAKIASSSYYSQGTALRQRKDRLARVTGYRAQQKLERIGLEPVRPADGSQGSQSSPYGQAGAAGHYGQAGVPGPYGPGGAGGRASYNEAVTLQADDGQYHYEYQAVSDRPVAGLRSALSETPDKNGRALSMKPVITHTSSIYVEADYVCRTIKEIRELFPEASIAILYRAHYVAMQLENALVTSHIPYNVIGDQRFFDRKEIRDVIAYIRLRVNLDDDVAFRRVVNVPPRGFGKKRMEHLEALARAHGCSLFHALAHSSDDDFLYKRTEMESFVSTMTAMNAMDFRAPADDFEIIINNSGYEEWIKQSGEDERLENIASLKTYLNDFKKNQDDEVNLADFIANITLMTSMDENRPDAPVRLMTVHNAKGLEFDYVFVVSVNEAVFPSKKAINELNVEEERRLMYVAMTRARKQLFLSEAGGELQNRADPSARIKRQPSRFLSEVRREDVIEIGGSSADCISRDQTSARNSSGDHMTVGERFFHKLLGHGVVREVREADGEYLVFYEKLGRERTLAFTAKFERLNDAAAAAPETAALAAAQAVPSVPAAAAAPAAAAGAATAVGPAAAQARGMSLADFLDARKGAQPAAAAAATAGSAAGAAASSPSPYASRPHNFNYPEGDVEDEDNRSFSMDQWEQRLRQQSTSAPGAAGAAGPWGAGPTVATPASEVSGGTASAPAPAPAPVADAAEARKMSLADFLEAGKGAQGADSSARRAASPYGAVAGDSPFGGQGISPYGSPEGSPYARKVSPDDLWTGIGTDGSGAGTSADADAGASTYGGAVSSSPFGGPALPPLERSRAAAGAAADAAAAAPAAATAGAGAWSEPDDDNWFAGGDFNDSNDGDDDEFVPVEALSHVASTGKDGGAGDGAGGDEALGKFGVNNFDLDFGKGYGFGRGRSMRELKYLMPGNDGNNGNDQT